MDEVENVKSKEAKKAKEFIELLSTLKVANKDKFLESKGLLMGLNTK
ncbi:hypothetical protein [Clostridioides sp. ES-S-0048-02]|nr:hypothetical protein [Clostridioides sp. ES-S-0048-02]